MTIRNYEGFSSPLPHPGEILRDDYLPGYGLTVGALAKAMRLKDVALIERLVREAQPVTADTALRLGKVFGTSPDFWMNLQAQHDLSAAAILARSELKAIAPLTPAA